MIEHINYRAAHAPPRSGWQQGGGVDEMEAGRRSGLDEHVRAMGFNLPASIDTCLLNRLKLRWTVQREQGGKA